MLGLVLASLLFLLLYFLLKKPGDLPPGRWGLPIIGYVPLYTRDMGKVVSDLRKEYGDIFTWKMGVNVAVTLCDYNLIKTTFSKPECQGRPYLFSRYIFNYSADAGLILSTGKTWSDGRRFALRHLKDFGMGKSSMEGIIQHEALALTKSYEKTAGKPVEFTWNLNVAVVNVLWMIVANQRYDIDNEDIFRFNKLLAEDIDIVQGPINLLDVFPGLYKILPNYILNNWMKMNAFRSHLEEYKDFFMDIIRKHEKTFDPSNPRDYIDAYLKEIQNEKGNADTIFKEDYFNLMVSISSLFRAGSETTSSTIRWLVALMAAHPHIQEKMQKEIDEVIPRDKVPSLQDRERMPYTEAVLFEVLRFSSLVPMGLFHSTTEDTEIAGYRIPKGTMLIAHAEGCHRDPKHWEKPDEFYPEHFLDDEGNLLTKKEGCMPFSLGRRQCLGENLARMELFLFATCLLQGLSFAPPAGETIKAETDRTKHLLHFVCPFKVVVTKRD